MNEAVETKPTAPAEVDELEPRPAWKRWRDHLEVIGARVLVRVIPLLPRQAVHSLGALAGWVAYHLLRTNKRIALANLDLAFGDSKTAAEKKWIARRSCQNFAITILMAFWSPRLNQDNFHEVVDTDEAGLELVRRLRAQGKAIMFVTLHYGNWELLGLATGWNGIPMSIITRTMRNPALEEIFAKLRAAAGHRIVPRRHGVGKLLKALKRGECIALLVDQHVSLRMGGIWCRFFGVPALSTPAIAQLAMHSGAAIVCGAVFPQRGGRSRIVYGPEITYMPSGDRQKDILTISQQCMDYCENVIRQGPEHWLWSYKRWKIRPTPELGRHPFYSKYKTRPGKPIL